MHGLFCAEEGSRWVLLSVWIAWFQAGGQGEQIYRARSGFTVSRGRVGYLRVRELQVQQVGPELVVACDHVLVGCVLWTLSCGRILCVCGEGC